MEDPAAAVRWADYTAARGRFFDRIAPPARAPDAPGLAAVPPLEGAWCSGWPEEVAACFTPDGVRRELGRESARFQGRLAIARAAARIMGALPGCALDVTRVVRGGEATVVEWTLRGTTLAVAGVSVCLMEGQLIREERVYWDGAALTP